MVHCRNMIAALMAISTCTVRVSRRASGRMGVAGVAGVVIYLFNVLTGSRVAVPAARRAEIGDCRHRCDARSVLAERELGDPLTEHGKIHSRRRCALRYKTRG